MFSILIGIPAFSLRNGKLIDKKLFRPRGWLLSGQMLYLFVVVFLIVVFNTIRTSSNLEYLFDQSQPLYVISEKVKYEDESVRVSSIKVSRLNKRYLHRIKHKLIPSRMLLFEFDVNNEYILYADAHGNFLPMSSQQALRRSGADFTINTSFYGQKNQILGELILNGINYGTRSTGSGFFKVINGRPYVGPRSLFEDLDGKVEYSCQAFPSVMKNGVIFSYVENEVPPYTSSWKAKTYRNLIGQKENGDILILTSNRGALLSVKEITMLAKSRGVKNASLFDGGIALQYSFRKGFFRTHFSVFNNTLSLGPNFESYLMRTYRINFKQRSPVFLTIRSFD